MTTKTFSYTDNSYTSSASRVTWTLTYTFPDVTASGTTFSIPNLSVTVKAKSNWYIRSLSGSINLNDIRIGGRTTSKSKTASFHSASQQGMKTWNSSISATGTISCNTSSFFTSSNKTTKKLLVKSFDTDLAFENWCALKGGYLIPDKMKSNNSYTLSNSTYEMGYVTLNAPPTYAVGTMTKDTVNYYKGLTTVSVPVNASSGSYGAKYGGDITSIKLTIGSQTKTVTPNSPKYSGNLSIKLSTAGTFTPSVTVTDSRGQVTTKTLSKITVVQPSAPTFQVGTLYKTQSSPENGYWTKLTTACVDVSNIQTYAGGYVKSIALYFEKSGTTTDLYGTKLDFTQSSQPSSPQTISCLLTRSGNFTPLVRLIDSANQTKDIRLSSISVNQYTLPGISDLKLERALNGPNLLPPVPPGILDPEGKYCLIESTFTYQNDMAELLEPIVKVRDKDAQEISSVTTWYTNWNETSGLSSPVNWTNYNPLSPVTLYALTSISNGIFEHAESYEIFIQAKDSNNFSSDIITQTLPTAFFTLDFLAGGREVAFGQSAHIDHLYQSLLDLNLSQAPDFYYSDYGFYERVVDNNGIVSYVELETEPSDWSTNWESYFLLKHHTGLLKCNMDMEIDSVEVDEDLKVLGETKLGGELYVAGNIYPDSTIYLTNYAYYTQASTVDMSIGDPTSDVWRGLVIARDDGGKNFASVTSVVRSTGQVQTYLQAQRNVSGTNTQNNLTLGVAKDGTLSYFVSSPLQFRSAIGIRHGQTAGITVLAGMYNDASISFGKTYSSAPTVIVGFVSSSIEGGFGKCSCAVHSVTTTGCKVRVFNGDTVQRTPNVAWVAIG